VGGKVGGVTCTIHSTWGDSNKRIKVRAINNELKLFPQQTLVRSKHSHHMTWYS